MDEVIKFVNLAVHFANMSIRLNDIMLYCIAFFIVLIMPGFITNQNDKDSLILVKTINDTIEEKSILTKLDTLDYLELRKKIESEYKDAKPGQFGEFIKGVITGIDTSEKIVALTFDACGGNGNGYNANLINYLRRKTFRLRYLLAESGLI